MGGIRNLSLGFDFLSQKSLSDLEQARLSGKKCKLNALEEMVVVCFLVRFVCYFIDSFPY